MATIFHLALASDWEAAQAAGTYVISTRGRTLAEEGFIHASRGDQWPGVRARFYGDVTEPLVLLRIDTDLLDVPVVEEAAVPGGTETFPHIYGPLPVSAVAAAIPLASPPPPAVAPPVMPTAPAPHRDTPGSGETFTQAYFREMFFNASLVLLVIALGVIGGLVGGAIDHAHGETNEIAGFCGLVGVAAGVAVAVLLYRRRR